MHLWPRTLEVPILDPAKAMKQPVGILNVKVVRAMKLKKRFSGGLRPFCEIETYEDELPSKKTTVKHGNLNPEWNEEFSMAVKDPESQSRFVVPQLLLTMENLVAGP